MLRQWTPYARTITGALEWLRANRVEVADLQMTIDEAVAPSLHRGRSNAPAASEVAAVVPDGQGPGHAPRQIVFHVLDDRVRHIPSTNPAPWPSRCSSLTASPVGAARLGGHHPLLLPPAHAANLGSAPCRLAPGTDAEGGARAALREADDRCILGLSHRVALRIPGGRRRVAPEESHTASCTWLGAKT